MAQVRAHGPGMALLGADEGLLRQAIEKLDRLLEAMQVGRDDRGEVCHGIDDDLVPGTRWSSLLPRLPRESGPGWSMLWEFDA